MIPKKGTSVPKGRLAGHDQCARDLAIALQREFGAGSHAAKTIMRWTGVSNRGARYWLSGERCPNGWQLILLARNSDQVLRTILGMCGRPAMELHFEIDAVRLALNKAMSALSAIDRECEDTQAVSARGPLAEFRGIMEQLPQDSDEADDFS